MNCMQLLTQENDITYTTTQKRMDRVDPDSLAWKPGSGQNWMTMGQLRMHIANACGAGCKGFVTGDGRIPAGKKAEDLSPEEMMPPAEMLSTIPTVEKAKRPLAKDKSVALKMIEQAGENELAHREIAALWAPGKTLALGFHLLKMIRHLGRHEGQLFYYLKLQGKPVNTVDLWGDAS